MTALKSLSKSQRHQGPMWASPRLSLSLFAWEIMFASVSQPGCVRRILYFSPTLVINTWPLLAWRGWGWEPCRCHAGLNVTTEGGVEREDRQAKHEQRDKASCPEGGSPGNLGHIDTGGRKESLEEKRLCSNPRDWHVGVWPAQHSLRGCCEYG